MIVWKNTKTKRPEPHDPARTLTSGAVHRSALLTVFGGGGGICLLVCFCCYFGSTEEWLLTSNMDLLKAEIERKRKLVQDKDLVNVSRFYC